MPRPDRPARARRTPPARGRRPVPGRAPRPKPKPKPEPTLQDWLDRFADARAAGDLLAARRAAIKAKAAAPRRAEVREALGLVAFELGNWREAALELSAFRRFTGDRRYDAAIADTYTNRGDPEKALDLLDDLGHGTVAEETWAEAQGARARAMRARGNSALARRILETARRQARTRAARTLLDLELRREA